MIKIAITTPISGKDFIIYDFLKGIKKIVKANPEIDWSWVVCDTSGSQIIKARLDDCAKELGIEYIYSTFDFGVEYHAYSYMQKMEELRHYMPKLYNAMMSKVPECDYVLNIEDDIVCTHDNPIPLMLEGFDENTCAIVGITHTRRLNHSFGRVQGFNLIDGIPTYLTPKKGFEYIDRTAFGFLMIKRKYAIMEYVELFAEAKSFDPAFGARMEALGQRIKICWEVKTKHYFKSKEGMVGYASEKDAPLNIVQKQWHRKESPLFLYVPADLELTEEIVKRHLKGQPIY